MAIEIAGGTQQALAKRCGKKQGHVSSWLKQSRVTGETAVLIDKATAGAVPKHRLRPDLFDRPADEHAA